MQKLTYTKTFVILFFLFASGSLYAKDENVALNRKYFLQPAPSYSHCLDNNDYLQLTDGFSKNSDWMQKTSVGWQKPRQPIEILMDLGSAQTVSQIELSTIGGGFADVYLPEIISCLGSMDGQNYYLIGVTTNQRVTKTKSKVPQVINLDLIPSKWRYLKTIVIPRGDFFFVDELKAVKFAAETECNIELLNCGNRNSKLFDFLRRYYSCLSRLETLRNSSKHIAVSENALAAAEQVFSSLNAITEPGLQKCFENLEKATYAIYGFDAKTQYLIFPANAGENFSCNKLFTDEPQNTKNIEFFSWQHGYAMRGLNILNVSSNSCVLKTHISPLISKIDGRQIANKYITLRAAQFVWSKSVGNIADALPSLSSAIEIRPGEVLQIIVEFNSLDLEPGKYSSALAMDISSASLANKLESVNLDISVSNLAMPAKMSLKSTVWAYPNKSNITKSAPNAVSMDLKEHYTNVFVVHPSEIPWPEKPGSDASATAMDRFGSLLDNYKFAETFLLYLELNQSWTSQKFGQIDTGAWDKNFSSWILQIENYFKNKGLTHSNYAIYLFDEQVPQRFQRIASVIRQTSPEIKIYANRLEIYGKLESYLPLVDIWAPSVTQIEQNKEAFNRLKSAGKTLWTYDTHGPGKANDPYGYYRLLPWKAFRLGISGAGFWVYADEGDLDTSNDMWAPSGFYGVIYKGNGNEVIIPSRRWQLWRLGIQDYELLYELKQQIQHLANTDASKAAQYSQLLDTKINAVLSKPEDKTLADNVYKELSEVLSELGEN